MGVSTFARRRKFILSAAAGGVEGLDTNGNEGSDMICQGHHSVHPGYFAVQRSDWLSIQALQLPFARSRTRAM